MQANDRMRLAQAIRKLAAHYPRTDIPVATIEAYVDSLTDLPLVLVVPAIERCAKTKTFFPAVAEIRQEVGEAAVGSDEIAETAWLEVLAQVRRCGLRPTRVMAGGEWHETPRPEFSNDLIRRVVQSLSWDVICTGEQVKVRREFIFAYRQIHDATVGQIQRGNIDIDAQLPGTVERVKEIA